MKFIRFQKSIINLAAVEDVSYSKDKNRTYIDFHRAGDIRRHSFDGDVRDELWELIKEAQKPAEEVLQFEQLKTDEPDEDEEISLDSEFTTSQAIVNLEGDIALLGSRIQQRSEVTARRFDEVHARLARLEEDNAKTQYPGGLPIDNGCQR